MHDGNSNKIGVIEAVCYCVSDIVGSGIFISPTSILKHSGSLGLSLCIWAGSAFISMIGALVYVELGTTIRKSGCDFAYLTHAKWYPFASAFIFTAVTLSYPGVLAIQAMAFGEYVIKGINMAADTDFKTSDSILPRLIGFSALLPLTFINLFSLKKIAGRFQVVVTIAKLLVVLLIIVTGFWFIIVKGKTSNFHDGFKDTTRSADDIVLALYNGLFAYNGWDILNFGTEEIENPRRTLPIAAFAGISIAAVVYVSMNLAYFSVLTVEEFKNSDTVAVDFARKTLGDFSYAIPFLIAMLLLSSMNSTIFGSSRYLFAGSKQGVLPSMFRCVHPTSMSPRAAILVEVVVAIGISFIGNLDHILSYMTFAIWMQRTVVQVALVYMRWKKFPVPDDAFQNPIFVPITFFCICIALLVIPVKTDWTVGIYAVGFVILGFIIYFVFVFPKKLPQFLHKINETTVICTQLALDTMPVPLNDDALSTDPIKEIPTSTVSSIEVSWSTLPSETVRSRKNTNKVAPGDDDRISYRF
uniref:Amino acid transporter n=1 Tax=Panagrellus redivivus TaxID=6233 RepID=A0A7E4WC20_PANRE